MEARVSNSRSMKASYKPQAVQTRVWWRERGLEPDSFDKYKGRLADVYATTGEPVTTGEPAGQVLVCQARDESSHLLVVDSELRFGYDDISEWPAAEDKLVECIKRLPIAKRPGLKLDVHLDGELLIQGTEDTGTIVDPGRLGLSEKAIADLPGTVAFCGVLLYVCEHPVHTTIRFTPGLGKDDGVAVYIGRRGISFTTVAQLRRVLADTIRIASDNVAKLVSGSWLGGQSK